jgi:GTPase SAR1 family protein
MSNNSDGGKWALAGYLYQVIGMVSITARASTPIVISRDGSDELVDAVISFEDVGEGLQAYHERFGQDVVFEQGDECVIVQFKYSTSGRKISKGELWEIIEKLDHSAQQAEAQGLHVTACALVTNRELTSRGRAARQLWDDERLRTRSYALRRRSVSMENLLAKIQEFGKRHGLFDREIESGVDRLIGRVFRTTGDLFGSSIDETHLVESFTGYHDAKQLTVSDVAPQCWTEIDEFGSLLLTDQWNDVPIEREVFQDVMAAVNARALVGIYGNGGCGKSIILWQLLKQVLDENRGCCTIASARDVAASWITDTVHRWRHLPPGNQPNDNREEATYRVDNANANQYRPVIWLALDGLDEFGGSVRDPVLGEVIRWFWRKDREIQGSDEPLLATLVVSCRGRDDLADKWIGLPPDYAGEWPVTIPVGDFSDSELEDAARQNFPELYRGMATDYWNPPRHREAGDLFRTVERVSPYSSSGSINVQVLEALRHPIMWRALLNLNNGSARERIADGEVGALRQLAYEFIKLFRWKLARRVQGRLGSLSVETLIEILQAVARHSDSASVHSRDRDWGEPACLTHHIIPNEAMTLYEEALSAGLITEDARSEWRWRHSIVHDYLVSEQ